MSAEPVRQLVDDLFRHQWGQLVATLTRILRDVDLAEEVVQEALLKALRVWPYRGVPDNPAAWLVTAARNRALDQLRHSSRVQQKQQQVLEALEPLAESDPPARELLDDQIRLLLLCCAPELSEEARLPLTLKLLGGFSNDEIARALLIQPATAAQRIVRAKRRMRSTSPDFALDGDRMRQRLPAVLKIVYLMFNEGYAASGGDELVRFDLCREAVRLGTLLADHPATAAAETEALLALMLLQSARLPARCDATGALLRLEEQDRSRWDPICLREGFARLERSARGDSVSEYHLQAAIAAEHASAPAWEETDWGRIVELYDQLLEKTGSPLVGLNRAVAVARVEGPGAALAEVERLADAPELQNYYLLPATRGQLLLDLGRPDSAAGQFQRALELPCSEPERRLLRRWLAEANGREDSASGSKFQGPGSKSKTSEF